ncbi:hypothetical protein ACLOJK_029587 [Asimina triloba]
MQCTIGAPKLWCSTISPRPAAMAAGEILSQATTGAATGGVVADRRPWRRTIDASSLLHRRRQIGRRKTHHSGSSGLLPQSRRACGGSGGRNLRRQQADPGSEIISSGGSVVAIDGSRLSRQQRRTNPIGKQAATDDQPHDPPAVISTAYQADHRTIYHPLSQPTE